MRSARTPIVRTPSTPSPARAAPIPSTLSGMRVLRMLGSGKRARVLLCHDESRGQVAVKVAGSPEDLPGFLDEVGVLSRIDHPHVVRLVDMLTEEDGRPAAVLERLGPATLATLLAERGSIRAGEAVTLLAPIAEAVDAVHRAGGTHGAICASAVLLRATGAPVLGCFGASRRIAATNDAALALDPGVRADRAALEALAARVLECVEGDALASVRGVLPELARVDHPGTAIAEALFDAVEPEAVRLGAVREVTPGRVTAPASWTGSVDIRSMRSTAENLLRAAAGSLGLVRRRVWIGAGAVACLAVATLVAVGIASGDAASTATADSRLTASAAPRESSTAPVDADPRPQGDDPEEAVAALLEARDRCLEQLSLTCVEGITQPGSSAFAADTARVSSIVSGEEIPDDPVRVAGSPTLVERLGDSALVALGAPETAPASVLLMRTEAGWRFRDYYAGE